MSQVNNTKFDDGVIRVPSRTIRTTDNNNNNDARSRDSRDDIEIIDLDSERLHVADHTWGEELWIG